MVEMIERVEDMPEVVRVIVDIRSVDCAGVDTARCDCTCIDVHYILDISIRVAATIIR
jgi:hypothetical protein